ncbi:MAG TPA: hypothetical protein VN448_04610 [Gammaproteobacteria bacterium]|jgi:hypothetical protein|nr:hypothetical protein [Gammaproteobacteria bacterium]
MDIARLASTAYTAQNYPVPSRGRERVLELVSEVDASRPARETVERVVQGEVLQRERTVYSSTWDYLGSRLFEGTYGINGGGMDDRGLDDIATDTQKQSSPNQSGYAVGAYLSHTRELIQPDIGRGKQVDYFI